MCGIFGFYASKENLTENQYIEHFNNLFLLSESRGKEASGLCLSSTKSVSIYKEPIPASLMIKKKEYKNFFKKFIKDNFSSNNSKILSVGHSRMVTNGDENNPGNNQPVVKDGFICLHNGIIVNDEKLWRKYPSLKRKFSVDSEIINSLLAMRMNEGFSFEESISELYSEIEGAASTVLMKQDSSYVYFATNTGSLYIAQNKTDCTFVFASEKSILKKFMSQLNQDFSISQVKPKNFLKFDISTGKTQFLNFERKEKTSARGTDSLIGSLTVLTRKFEDLSLKEFEARDRIRRCTRCILPETIPFIRFDSEGVCQKCRSYENLKFHGRKKLEEILKRSKPSIEGNNCLVALSGGRDSSYGLYYLTKEIGFKPVAYTYDWGLVTDLARRNISRLCAKLGVEHILVSADIRKKREKHQMNG